MMVDDDASPAPWAVQPAASGFAHDLRTALAARRSTLRGLSLALQQRGVTVSTPLLAAWRSGTFTPSGPTDLVAAHALEDLLALPPGQLTRWVDPDGTPRRPGQRPVTGAARPVTRLGAGGDDAAGGGAYASPRATGVDRAAASVQRARTALGFERSGLLTERTVDVVLSIDDSGVEQHVTQRTEWVAREDGVDSFPSVLVVPPGVRERAHVEPLTACRLGPAYVDLVEGVFATALVLPHPLRAGESVTTVHRVHLPADAPSEGLHQHRVSAEVERISVAVSFETTCAPSSWIGYSCTEEQERSAELAPLDGVVRVARDDFGPGVVGVRWHW